MELLGRISREKETFYFGSLIFNLHGITLREVSWEKLKVCAIYHDFAFEITWADLDKSRGS